MSPEMAKDYRPDTGRVDIEFHNYAFTMAVINGQPVEVRMQISETIYDRNGRFRARIYQGYTPSGEVLRVDVGSVYWRVSLRDMFGGD